MKRFVLWAVLIMALPHGWEITFEPHAENVGIQMETDCQLKGEWVYASVDYIQVEPSWDRVTLRRHDEVPTGSTCHVRAHLFRNPGGSAASTENDYLAESSGFVRQQ